MTNELAIDDYINHFNKGDKNIVFGTTKKYTNAIVSNFCYDKKSILITYNIKIKQSANIIVQTMYNKLSIKIAIDSSDKESMKMIEFLKGLDDTVARHIAFGCILIPTAKIEGDKIYMKVNIPSYMIGDIYTDTLMTKNGAVNITNQKIDFKEIIPYICKGNELNIKLTVAILYQKENGNCGIVLMCNAFKIGRSEIEEDHINTVKGNGVIDPSIYGIGYDLSI